MSVMAKHAYPEIPGLPPEAKTSVKAAAWIILGSMGGTSVTFQVWHAVHSHMVLGLAVLFGLAPVIVSMCLSHIGAELADMGIALQAAIYLSVALAMALSLSAIATVVAPAAGSPQRWLFGLVLDGPSLICLRVIIVQQKRKVARAAAEEAMERARAEAAEKARAEAVQRAIEEARAKADADAAEKARIDAATTARAAAEARATARAEARARNAPKDPQAERARREYRKSVLAGAPLTDRALAEKFDRSRTWAGNRIREVQETLNPGDASGTLHVVSK